MYVWSHMLIIAEPMYINKMNRYIVWNVQPKLSDQLYNNPP